MGKGIDYKKYDVGGVTPVAPSTTKKPEKTIPGSFGREKGGLAKGLRRGRDIDKEMGYK